MKWRVSGVSASQEVKKAPRMKALWLAFSPLSQCSFARALAVPCMPCIRVLARLPGRAFGAEADGPEPAEPPGAPAALRASGTAERSRRFEPRLSLQLHFRLSVARRPFPAGSLWPHLEELVRLRTASELSSASTRAPVCQDDGSAHRPAWRDLPVSEVQSARCSLSQSQSQSL